MSREYVVRIYLDSPLLLRVIEFQNKKKLHKTYAGLLIFIEGLKSLGLITKDEYEYYRSRYDKPLENSPIKVGPLPKPKCYFCSNDAVGEALFIPKNIVYPVCENHKKLIVNHPKWKVIK